MELKWAIMEGLVPDIELWDPIVRHKIGHIYHTHSCSCECAHVHTNTHIHRENTQHSTPLFSQFIIKCIHF